ncbi:hypothetical protein KEM54_004159, partial [Ascosphaera aggregata]
MVPRSLARDAEGNNEARTSGQGDRVSQISIKPRCNESHLCLLSSYHVAKIGSEYVHVVQSINALVAGVVTLQNLDNVKGIGPLVVGVVLLVEDVKVVKSIDTMVAGVVVFQDMDTEDVNTALVV